VGGRTSADILDRSGFVVVLGTVTLGLPEMPTVPPTGCFAGKLPTLTVPLTCRRKIVHRNRGTAARKRPTVRQSEHAYAQKATEKSQTSSLLPP